MTAHLIALFRQLRSDERGVSTMEYGVLGGAIIVACVAAATALEGFIGTSITKITGAVGAG